MATTLEVTEIAGDKKAVWFSNKKFEIGLQIGMEDDCAYFSVHDKVRPTKAHALAIGVNSKGDAFLQVCKGDEVVTVDLMDLVKHLKSHS